MNVAGRILPHHVVTGSIGWIGGLGAVGSAVVPFITGAVAGQVGIKSLQPLCVNQQFAFVPKISLKLDIPVASYCFLSLLGMTVFMLILWTLVPQKRPHSD
jgi:nitrate/nitrite transporter NarK